MMHGHLPYRPRFLRVVPTSDGRMPPLVRVDFFPPGSAPGPVEPLQVEVIDLATARPVHRDRVNRVGEWLETFGYRWVTGTNGIWQRA